MRFLRLCFNHFLLNRIIIRIFEQMRFNFKKLEIPNGQKLRNGHSHANLANLSTRQKFTIFGKYSNLPKWSFSEMCQTCHTRRHSPNCFAQTRQIRRDSPKAIFEKNVTRLPKFARVLSESHKFGESGHSLTKVQKLSKYTFELYPNIVSFF